MKTITLVIYIALLFVCNIATASSVEIKVKSLDGGGLVTLSENGKITVFKDGDLYRPNKFMLTPITLKITEKVQFISGELEGLAVTEQGKVYLWKGKCYGEDGLGNCQYETRHIPIPIKIVKAYFAATREKPVFFAIDVNGGLWGWGETRIGHLGRIKDAPKPLRLPLPFRVESLAVGPVHVLALDIDGRVWNWGDPLIEDRILIQGDIIEAGDITLQRVSGLPRIKIVSCYIDSFAVDFEGRLWSWGASTARFRKSGRIPLHIVPGVDHVLSINSASNTTMIVDESNKIFVIGHAPSRTQSVLKLTDDFDLPVLIPNILGKKASANWQDIAFITLNGELRTVEDIHGTVMPSDPILPSGGGCGGSGLSGEGVARPGLDLGLRAAKDHPVGDASLGRDPDRGLAGAGIPALTRRAGCE